MGFSWVLRFEIVQIHEIHEMYGKSMILVYSSRFQSWTKKKRASEWDAVLGVQKDLAYQTCVVFTPIAKHKPT